MLKNIYKFDTLLAFVISSVLYYYFNKNVYESLRFSILFVLIFLFFLKILV